MSITIRKLWVSRMPSLVQIKLFLNIKSNNLGYDIAFSQLQLSRAKTADETQDLLSYVLQLEEQKKINQLSSAEYLVLGLCYQQGDAVKQDYGKAWECYDLANNKYSYLLRAEIYDFTHNNVDSLVVQDIGMPSINTAQTIARLLKIIKLRNWCMLCDALSDEVIYQNPELIAITKAILPELEKWLDPTVKITFPDDYRYLRNDLHKWNTRYVHLQKIALILYYRMYLSASTSWNFNNFQNLEKLLSLFSDYQYIAKLTKTIDDLQGKGYEQVQTFNDNERDQVLRYGIQHNRWWALQLALDKKDKHTGLLFIRTHQVLYSHTVLCKAVLHEECPEQVRQDICDYFAQTSIKEKHKFSVLSSSTQVELCKFYLSLILSRDKVLSQTSDLDGVILGQARKQNLSISAQQRIIAEIKAYYNCFTLYNGKKNEEDFEKKLQESEKQRSEVSAIPPLTIDAMDRQSSKSYQTTQLEFDKTSMDEKIEAIISLSRVGNILKQ